jgi:hypothetical protein
VGIQQREDNAALSEAVNMSTQEVTGRGGDRRCDSGDSLLKAWDWHFLVPVVVICFEHLLIVFGIHETGVQKRRAFISMQIRESRSLTQCWCFPTLKRNKTLLSS